MPLVSDISKFLSYIKDELLKRGIPVQINLFENEGHGFKDGKIKVDVLKKTEAFFRQYLNL